MDMLRINGIRITGITDYQYDTKMKTRTMTTVDGTTIVKKMYDVAQLNFTVNVRTQARLTQLLTILRNPVFTVEYFNSDSAEMKTGTFVVSAKNGPPCLSYPSLWGDLSVTLDGAEALS